MTNNFCQSGVASKKSAHVCSQGCFGNSVNVIGGNALDFETVNTYIPFHVFVQSSNTWFEVTV